jgi:hypothetical protein
MSLTTWTQGARGVRDGEPVDAATTNRPTADLLARDEYLKELIDALHLGETLYLRDRAVAPECYDGCAVYYDADQGRFAPALASAGADGDVLAIDVRARVVGVTAHKHSATNADLAIAGSVRPPIDTVDEPAVSGLRYLSATEPGRIVAARPALAIPVGQWLAEYNVLIVQPLPRDVIDTHTHYRFKLFTTPAGVANNPAFMDRHAIATANPALPGWLPANHSVFGGAAPDGAKFGYNLSRHPELFKVFPPVPLDGAYIEAYLDGAGAGRELGSVAQVTSSGIWWMRDDWGWAPWQLTLEGLDTDPDSVVTPPETPPPIELQHGHGYVAEDESHTCPFSLYLWFSKPTYHTDNAVAASLIAKEGSPLLVTDCLGKPASTGHLMIDIDLKLLDDGADYPGHIVVKEFDGKTLKRGSVVSGLRSDNNIIQLSSADGLLPDDDGYYPGRVTLVYNDPSVAARELDVSLFALDGATEEKYAGMFYLGFPAGRRTSVRGRIDIPAVGMPSGQFQITLALRMLGTAAGSLPPLQFTYRRLPAVDSTAALPESSSEVTLAPIQPVQSLSAANTYFDCLAPGMQGRAGDTLMFTLQRGVDAYGGIVGVIRSRGRIG